ncbi:DUF5701 family protein [Trujillonella endophytica]|uniref:Uncharacterized protein n=1 Tax=Trujillonella endophytica TaxID=673521 RepID=A0A1H8WD37_9ACTN|nr:DUF5701 family protein [Trujillella endophytica]SEP25556.1 hypothetical protein SAMN05660991_04298 [Trujillella endophytica]
MSALPTLPALPAATAAELEFDRQVHALVATGLPPLLGLAEECFRACCEPLRDVLPTEPVGGRVPFVVVVPDVPVLDVLATVQTAGGGGFCTMEPGDLAGFRPLPELGVPPVPYLLLDVDTGADTLNVRPRDVAPRLAAAGRTPLTVAEGLALLVSDPGVLRSRGCYSLLGSRAGDKRVPALWVSGRRPRLGWCYEGAPHTWLGTASCAARGTGGPAAPEPRG